jgi:hypothetical protein
MSVYRLSLEAAQSPPFGGGGGNDNSALAGLTKFIPTETVTLYIVSISFFSQITNFWSDFKSIYAYFSS